MEKNSGTIELAKELIACRSITPDDMGCQSIMIDRLEKIGFKVNRLRFGDVDNFWAIRGDTGDIFAFAGHTDVVPVGDENNWDHPPFEPTISEGMLCGRGAADMKGSLAAMIIATENFIEKHPNHNHRIAFLITSDEEGEATNGTIKVIDYLNEINESIKWCIVGEPSSTNVVGDTIKNGRRGSLNLCLTVHGKQGHVAYPHLAKNPILEFSSALDELSNTIWDSGNDFFPPTTFQISNVNSGTGATNVIPAELKVLANFRFSSEITVDQIKNRFTSILEKNNLNYSIEWNLSGNPFLTECGTLIEISKKAINDICGIETVLSTGGGTSDGRFIAPTGAELVELGPVNATIHRVNERVKIEDLNKLQDIYFHIMRNILIHN